MVVGLLALLGPAGPCRCSRLAYFPSAAAAAISSALQDDRRDSADVNQPPSLLVPIEVSPMPLPSVGSDDLSDSFSCRRDAMDLGPGT